MAHAEPRPDAAPVRIALVDDHSIIHVGLIKVIEGLGNYKVSLTALNGQDFILRHGAAEQPVDIAIVDMYMPVMGGVETIQWLRLNWPDTRVLALSFDRSPQVVKEALGAGACGFIPKDFSEMELRDALEGVHRRGSYHHDRLIREHLAAGDAGATKDPLLDLTPMERRVLDCVCTDDEPIWEQVADRMGKGVPTVDTHRAALFRKLRVKSKPGLVSYGRSRGFGKGSYWKPA